MSGYESVIRSLGNMVLSNGGVSITFTQPEDESKARQLELASMVAERQCRAHLATHRTKEMSLKFLGRCPAPSVEVTFQSSLLQKLPLLADVQGSTEGKTSSTVQLPCTIWGLVSLLILLMEDVNVEDLFCGDPKHLDPELPSQTLIVRSLHFPVTHIRVSTIASAFFCTSED